MFSQIIIPLDGSARARRAIPVAARIAHEREGSIVLLSILAPPLGLASQAQLALIPPEDQAAELSRLTTSRELKGVKTVTEVAEGLPAAAILDRVQARQADLIVLCSHGRKPCFPARIGHAYLGRGVH